MTLARNLAMAAAACGVLAFLAVNQVLPVDNPWVILAGFVLAGAFGSAALGAAVTHRPWGAVAGMVLGTAAVAVLIVVFSLPGGSAVGS